jgi:hypothetical protein
MKHNVLAAAAEFQHYADAQRLDFCIIGGLAVGRWGEIRATQDVDATIFTGVGDESHYIQRIREAFETRPEHDDAMAAVTRVCLLRASNGVDINLSLAASEFEAEVIDRATMFLYAPRFTLKTCSAEDLVIYKAIAAREIDWADIRGILTRQHGQLDWDHILAYLKPLCELKEDESIVDRLSALRCKIDRKVRDID